MINKMLVASSFPLDYQNTILSDSPIAYYKLNESSGTIAHDISGNGNNGTYVGSLTLYNSNLISNSLSRYVYLPGSTSSYVSIPYSLVNNTNMTVEAWVNVQYLSQSCGSGNPSATGSTIITTNDGGGSNGWCFALGGTYKTWYWPMGGEDVKASSGTVSLNTIHYVVITISGATSNIYIDNQLITNGTTASPQISNTNAQIGGQSWIGGAFNGTIGEVAIYNYELTTTKINKHYLTGI